MFVGGLTRSGKSLMGSILGSHSRIAFPPEGTNLWAFFHGRFGDLRRDANLDRAIAGLLRYRHVMLLEPDEARIRAEARDGPRSYGHLFGLFLEHHAQAMGKPRWGDATGLIELHARRVFEAFPDARIIHMVRDPRDVFATTLRLHPGGRGGVGAATAWWRFSTLVGEGHARRDPSRYRLVRYEDLATSPDETVRSVCDFIGERFEPEMLEMRGAEPYAARLRRRRGQADSSQLVTPEYIGIHRGILAAPDVRFMEAHASGPMERHGYRPETPRIDGLTRFRRRWLERPSQVLRYIAAGALASLVGRSPWVAEHTIAARRRVRDPRAGARGS